MATHPRSTSVESSIELPPLTLDVLKACSFPHWYPRFARHTFPSTLIPLDQAFVDYLRDPAAGLQLPEDVDPLPSYESQLSDSDDSEHSQSSVDSDPAPTRPAFPELTATIARTIASYGGSVFPKLNWSAPQDAQFLLMPGDGRLRCRNAADVYMLLKSSDCVFHDLSLLGQSAGPEQLSPVLVLREWLNLNPAHEFRCFVRARRLIAVSARSSTFFDFLLPAPVRASIVDRITDFFRLVILPQWDLPDFIFDVYLKNPTKLSPTRPLPNLKLIDINPFASFMDPCLFSFEELESIFYNLHHETAGAGAGAAGGDGQVFIKVVENGIDRKTFSNKFDGAKVPLDFLELCKDKQFNQSTDQWKELLLKTELNNQLLQDDRLN